MCGAEIRLVNPLFQRGLATHPDGEVKDVDKPGPAQRGGEGVRDEERGESGALGLGERGDVAAHQHACFCNDWFVSGISDCAVSVFLILISLEPTETRREDRGGIIDRDGRTDGGGEVCHRVADLLGKELSATQPCLFRDRTIRSNLTAVTTKRVDGPIYPHIRRTHPRGKCRC